MVGDFGREPSHTICFWWTSSVMVYHRHIIEGPWIYDEKLLINSVFHVFKILKLVKIRSIFALELLQNETHY